MSVTATTYIVDWDRFVECYQAAPNGQLWKDELERKRRQQDDEEPQSAKQVAGQEAADWLEQDPIDACRVYENFHFWTDFADLYLRMRRDIPKRHLKAFDRFLGAFGPAMVDVEILAQLRDFGSEELLYMSVAPDTAAKYLELGESLNLQILRRPFEKNYNRLNQEDEDEPEYERDDFDSVWSYWIWRIKARFKPREQDDDVLPEDELTFRSFEHFEAMIRAWIAVLAYAVQNRKGIVITAE